jgi:hypothetical protein
MENKSVNTVIIKNKIKYDIDNEIKRSKYFILASNILDIYLKDNPNLQFEEMKRVCDKDKLIIKIKNANKISSRDLLTNLHNKGLIGSDFKLVSNTDGLINGFIIIPLNYDDENYTKNKDIINSSNSSLSFTSLFLIILLLLIIALLWNITSHKSKFNLLNSIFDSIKNILSFNSINIETNKQFNKASDQQDINKWNQNQKA